VYVITKHLYNVHLESKSKSRIFAVEYLLKNRKFSYFVLGTISGYAGNRFTKALTQNVKLRNHFLS